MGHSACGWCIQKYATAICPDAMNAAARVNRPAAISSPATSSITPAYHPGQAPTAFGYAARTGQSNTAIEPIPANSRPKTNRKRLSTAGE